MPFPALGARLAAVRDDYRWWRVFLLPQSAMGWVFVLMPPQRGLGAFAAPFTLGASVDRVFDVSPEWLADVEVVHIWLA